MSEKDSVIAVIKHSAVKSLNHGQRDIIALERVSACKTCGGEERREEPALPYRTTCMNGMFRRLRFDRQGPTHRACCIVCEVLIHECLGACETDGASDV